MHHHGTAHALTLTGELAAGDFTNLDPLEQALVSYLGRYENVKVRRDALHDITLFLGWCAREHVQPLTIVKPQILMYLHWLKQHGWSESTVSRRFGSVSVFYNNAVDDELLLRDPTRGVKRPQVDKGKQHRPALTMLDMIRVLDEAREVGPDALLLCGFMGQMALRLHEATQLRVENLTSAYGQRQINFVGKGDKAACMDVPMPLLFALNQCIAGRTDGPLLRNKWTKPLTDGTAYQMVKRIGVAAGIPRSEVQPHGFRRSAITIALDQGVPLQEVQMMARHENPSTTMRYYRGKNTGAKATQHLSQLYAAMLGNAA